LWPGWVGFDLAAELGHVDAKVMCLENAVWSPYFPEKLLVGDDLAGVLDQRRQQAIFDRSKVDFFVADEHLPADKINP